MIATVRNQSNIGRSSALGKKLDVLVIPSPSKRFANTVTVINPLNCICAKDKSSPISDLATPDEKLFQTLWKREALYLKWRHQNKKTLWNNAVWKRGQVSNAWCKVNIVSTTKLSIVFHVAETMPLLDHLHRGFRTAFYKDIVYQHGSQSLKCFLTVISASKLV